MSSGPAAQAAFPGQNGKIAFQQGLHEASQIRTINPDGSSDTGIANSAGADENPAWSPDGTKIAFESTRDDASPSSCGSGCNYEIYVMSADGTGVTRLTSHAASDRAARWSPDGSKIVFWSSRDGGGLYTMNADGTGVTLLHDSGFPFQSKWSPDGEQIAFEEFLDTSMTLNVMNADGTNAVAIAEVDEMHGFDWIPDAQRIVFSELLIDSVGATTRLWLINPDGSGQTLLTGNDALREYPAWSPDGRKIAYSGEVGIGSSQLWVMNADGTSQTRITPAGSSPKVLADWQPIPINAYPRPKGATPVHVSLVPAYTPCASPNRQHGPPLAFASCNPPAQTSDELTVGSADSNGRPTRSISDLRFKTLPGIPSTPADEADVALEAEVTDVYNQATLDDYAGELRAQASLRITDKLNTPHPGGPGAGTVSDISFGFTIPCAPTPDPDEGSSCTVNTTAEALFPGALVEGRRAIWQLGAVEVSDGGADADGDTAGDNTLLMKQGSSFPSAVSVGGHSGRH